MWDLSYPHGTLNLNNVLTRGHLTKSYIPGRSVDVAQRLSGTLLSGSHIKGKII